MEQSQCYIGAINGVVVCVDRAGNYQIGGRFYHSYREEAVEFDSLEQFLFRLERFYNMLRFPFPSTNDRVFLPSDTKAADQGKRVKIVKDEELLERRGDLGSFIVRVQHRQNSSWQGRITWIEENRTVNFRSMWEMIKLMDNAMGACEAEDENLWDSDQESQKPSKK